MLPSKEFFREYARERNIPWRERNILLEYLQTLILKALSLSKWNDHISFMGGTCLRFAYGIDRFSEDLDFDLVKGFDVFDPDRVATDIRKRLELQGFSLDSQVKSTENIHIISFGFREVLREFGVNASKSEKVLIKFEIDPDPHRKMSSEVRFFDSFNERFPVLVNPLETMFAQKVSAIFLRPYHKGRDFYDLVWFLGKKDLEPEYGIFEARKLGIRNREELLDQLSEVVKNADLRLVAKDVERFLFHPEQVQWIERLPEYLESFREAESNT